ncbi:ABC transporter permease [Paraburkholderia sp.]|uniref:ABC transporter permease n=1 Tax=Paraburkholderia sp. TaxID=1926495 RepID=UPI0023972643|nr:ABC transporter permease [Paraburkholderia sp.]MDE1179342.1 ABC transporter permease [Paraburkholderia sp.]
MANYLIKRFLLNIPILLAVLAVVFVFVRLAPGDPVDAFSPPGREITAVQKEALRHQLGLDRPAYAQFYFWVKEVAQGNLGYRYKDGSPVSREIARRVPATLLLTGTGIGIGVVLGVLLGLVSAHMKGSVVDHGLALLAYIGVSGPVFLVGILALYFLSMTLGWFPTGGYATPGKGGAGDILWHLILPASVLSIQYVAILMRYTRASLLEVLTQDYIRTGRAKGLSRSQVLTRHAFRNALIPIVTVIGANFANIIGGAVFLETIFSWPGMGTLLLDGIAARDYPLIMGITLWIAIAVLVVNLLTDVVYALIDPRIALN